MARVAAITGASSGIGAATARALAGDGFEVLLGGRRLERLEEVAGEVGGEAVERDVTDAESVARFAERLPRCDVLVNNAGGALGLESIADADEEQWRRMFEANVMGTMRATKALPTRGRIVRLGLTGPSGRRMLGPPVTTPRRWR